MLHELDIGVTEARLRLIEGHVEKLSMWGRNKTGDWVYDMHYVLDDDVPTLVAEVRRLKRLVKEFKVCPDCRVYEGEFHVYGCGKELCPFCGQRLMSCTCVCEKLNIGSPIVALNDKLEKRWLGILDVKGRIPWEYTESTLKV